MRRIDGMAGRHKVCPYIVGHRRVHRVAALYVAPSCARRGVGPALLARAETAIRSAGYTIARLEFCQNALAFYLRRGYCRCGSPDANGAWPLSKDLAAVGPSQAMEPTRGSGQVFAYDRRIDSMAGRPMVCPYAHACAWMIVE